jgi:signal transduction histidine kinase
VNGPKESDVSPKHLTFLTALTQLCGGVAIWVGTLVLFGWTYNLEGLKRIMPGFVAMNPATACLFVLSGVALVLSSRKQRSARLRASARVLAVIVTIAALCEILQLIGFWHSMVDEFLFASKLSGDPGGLPNRMAPNTAFNFLFVGLSLLMLDAKTNRASLSQGLAILVGFGAILPLTGYAYGVQSFSGLASFIPMAIHTAVTFLILAAGLFFATPEAPLTQAFMTNDSCGVMARRLFPLALFLTLFLGWLRLWGERRELYDSAFGTALFAIALCILFAILVRWTVTKVGQLEEERAAVNARLQEVNRRKDEMIAVVSHDLCSPLTGFRMVIDLLREKPKQPSEELLDLMDHSARRMVSMVRGLLDISKLEQAEIQLEREELLISDVLRQSMEPLTINANAKHISLQLDVLKEEPVVQVDRLRVSQIFNNLLSNAVKFTAAGGKVVVTISPEADGVRIAVQDTGLGIPQNDLPHVFDKYYQASTKSTAGEKGTGLGLAIVRELVLLHGGQIDVTSELSRGTTFVVYLPREISGASQKKSHLAGVAAPIRSTFEGEKSPSFASR